MNTAWVFIVGEYPPASGGGVGDYTHSLAEDLASTNRVHVFAPPAGFVGDAGLVHVHRVANFFPPALLRMRRAIDAIPGPKRIVVQYVAQSYGWHGMNLFFALWLVSLRGRGLWTMFHEVETTFPAKFSAKRSLQALMTHLMAALIVRSSERVLVSTERWIPKLGKYRPRAQIENVPIPSNVATTAAPDAVEALRERYLGAGRTTLLAHFGTYRMTDVTSFLREILPKLLADERRVMVFLGHGSAEFAERLRAESPAVASRIVGTGSLESARVAEHLLASDIVLQPYDEGVTTRRGSVLAALALGSAIVTTGGRETEPIWSASGAIALAGPAPSSFLAAFDRVANDETERMRLRRESKLFYERCFALGRTVAVYRDGGV